jgi:dihydrofolate reductase
VDAIVMGRHTFETVLSFGAWPYGEMPIIVLTSRPDKIVAPDGAKCEAMTGTPREIAERLAERGLSHLYIDGGTTIQRFLDAGLIERFIVTRIPVVLGSGIPLFGPVSKDIRFEHITTHAYPSGLVQSEYRTLSLQHS